MALIDAHTHIELFAYQRVPLFRAKSLQEVLSMLRELKEPSVIWGWDEERIGTKITKAHLDSFDFPLLLIRVDGHMGVVNTAFEEFAKLEEGPFYERNSGFLYENYLWKSVEKLKPSGDKLTEVIFSGLLKAKEMGLTEVHDFVDTEIARIYIELEKELPIRVVLMPYYEHYKSVLEFINASGSSKTLMGWVKVYVDGSVGSRTAALFEPYRDQPSNRGKLMRSADEIGRIIEELEREHIRISLHAIGDRAIEECLRAFEESGYRMPFHRIEHAEMISESQAERVKKLKLLLCVQPNFNPFFMKTYIRALGPLRAGRMNPIGMLDELGVEMIFGSDMMPFDPNYGLNYAGKILGKEKALFYYGGWRNEKSYL